MTDPTPPPPSPTGNPFLPGTPGNPDPPQPAVSVPLPDGEIDEIFDGLFAPNEHSIKRMAYEIKKARGDKNPGNL